MGFQLEKLRVFSLTPDESSTHIAVRHRYLLWN